MWLISQLRSACQIVHFPHNILYRNPSDTQQSACTQSGQKVSSRRKLESSLKALVGWRRSIHNQIPDMAWLRRALNPHGHVALKCTPLQRIGKNTCTAPSYIHSSLTRYSNNKTICMMCVFGEGDARARLLKGPCDNVCERARRTNIICTHVVSTKRPDYFCCRRWELKKPGAAALSFQVYATRVSCMDKGSHISWRWNNFWPRSAWKRATITVPLQKVQSRDNSLKESFKFVHVRARTLFLDWFIMKIKITYNSWYYLFYIEHQRGVQSLHNIHYFKHFI